MQHASNSQSTRVHDSSLEAESLTEQRWNDEEDADIADQCKGVPKHRTVNGEEAEIPTLPRKPFPIRTRKQRKSIQIHPRRYSRLRSSGVQCNHASCLTKKGDCHSKTKLDVSSAELHAPILKIRTSWTDVTDESSGRLFVELIT